MLYAAILRTERAREPELWAILWQGKVPPGLKLLGVYYLMNQTRVILVEAEAPEDLQFLDRLNEAAEVEILPALEQTAGWMAAWRRDLDAIRTYLAERGVAGAALEQALELRRRGREAPTIQAARRAGRDWLAAQESGPARPKLRPGARASR